MTTGGLGTNHGLATTILGRDASLSTTLVLLHQPLTPAFSGSLLLHAAYGARSSTAQRAGHGLPGLRLLGPGCAEKALPGGHGRLLRRGHAGFVSAALELEEQVQAGCPEPAEIYVPVGTGGTLVGLAWACAHPAALARGGSARQRHPAALAAQTRQSRQAVLGGFAAPIRRSPSWRIDPADFLVAGQLGAGYGAPTPAAETPCGGPGCGLQLETTYTGKSSGRDPRPRRTRRPGEWTRALLEHLQRRRCEAARTAPLRPGGAAGELEPAFA